MKTVRLCALIPMLVACATLAGVSAYGARAADGSQVIDPSNTWSALEGQIATARQHGFAFRHGQLSSHAACGYAAATRPFAKLGDSGSYALPAAGDVNGWKLEHASVSTDHDQFTGVPSALLLQGNAKATTTPVCIGANNGSLRLMVRSNGPATSDLKVNVLYENPDGSVHDVTVAKLRAGSSWQPSVSIPLGISDLASDYPNGTAVIELEFQPEGLAAGDTWSIDGLFIAQTTLVPTDAGTTSTVPDAASGDLADISHQMADIQKRITDLQAKGGSATLGKLALAADCGRQTPSKVFLPWGDPADYALAPEGDLAVSSGWTFHNATVVAAHDGFTPGENSLALSRGDSQAVTPAMCVDLTNPTIRLFVRGSGGDGRSDIKVTVLYEDINGKTQHLDLARIRPLNNWAPSMVIPIGVNVLSIAHASGVTAVAFQFTVENLRKGETLSLDNVYVDPFCSR